MGLNNFYFLLQFILLLAVLAAVPLCRRQRDSRMTGRIQLGILLLYSYFFLYLADWRVCLCIVADTLLAYVCARRMERCQDKRERRRIAVWGGICLLIVLGYFKYADFFIESFAAAFHLNAGTLNLVLPLGISFFTFSGLSYLLDVYRGTCAAEKNLLDFGLYMALFSKITAGPLVRWTDLRPQIKEYRGICLPALNDGIQIFVFGLFKKMVLADHLGVFVDDVFFAPLAYSTGTVILSAFSYSLQIYLDFSGYSDMAVGISKIIGFDLKPNFDLPYMAEGFSDFWNRWHISLSSWFKDYLYIPLGGSRRGEARAYANLFIVMLVSGLWHGAGLTFLLWGGLHGVASCISRRLKKSGKERSSVGRCAEIILTFLAVTLFWTVFRAENTEAVVRYWSALFTLHSGICQPYTWTFFAAACVAVGTAAAKWKARGSSKEGRVHGFYPVMDLSETGSLVIFFFMCGLTVLLGYFGKTAFIYGGF